MKEHLSVNKCTKFQIDISKNGRVLPFWMSKRPFFKPFQTISAFLRFSIFFDLGRTKSVSGSFCALFTKLDAKTCSALSKPKIYILIFLTSWPWMILTWHEVTKGLEGTQRYLRHDPCRFIGFVSVWYRCFARRIRCWQIVKDLTFDLICGAIKGLRIKFCNIFRKFIPWAIKCRFGIENRSSSLADSTWGQNSTPPPSSAGRVRKYRIGARVK